MSQITGDYEQRQCTMGLGGCSFSYPTGDPCTTGDFNAFYIFVLWSIENFQRWINSLAGTVETTCEDVIGYSGELVDTFSHFKTPSTKKQGLRQEPKREPKEEPKEEPKAALMAALMAALKRALMEALKAGLMEALKAGLIGEMEGARKAIIDARITKVKISLVDQIKSFGSTILTQPVDETQVGYSYSDHANSGPFVLKNGVYANEFSLEGKESFAKNLKGSLLSGAISWIWKEEGVFIVKDSYAIDGTLPQNMNLDPDLSNRTCDNNGTCYWFLKNTGIGSPDNDIFNPVPGFDALKDFGIDALEFAQAADASQAAGGYLANWTMRNTLPFLKKYKPAKNMMVNLPVCPLNYFYDSWKDIDTSDYDYKGWDSNVGSH
ncbi:hypothetical protein N7510_000028 [Penicillium lagena]|uniref:uncharacterized protein n=1 Tax=Penicillium lagena TaxID=94218 RepID=UPI00253FB4F7|nr:uncharacterized protein N7510_000028 [Penicillium lagena]KAJ5623719.1 hypothetical protein N7510_000028 [Penicillium lagena]